MRFVLLLSITLLLASLTLAQPVITNSIIPRYIEGLSGTNAKRIPCAYFLTISGLTANATYRYLNQIVKTGDTPTYTGAGNAIYYNSTGFYRTSSARLDSTGCYGQFTASATGTYSGWFITEPTGNARFLPGAYLFMRVTLNDGNNGTAASTRLIVPDSLLVIKPDTTVSDSVGTGMVGRTNSPARHFVAVYDSNSATARPLAATFIESDGSANTAANSYIPFYANQVEGVTGAFGVIVPNRLANGIRRVTLFSPGGANISTVTSADGMWSTVNTVNPRTGETPLVINVTFFSSVRTSGNMTPDGYALLPNYPNPFNPTTTITYSVGNNESNVSLTIVDELGRTVATLVSGAANRGMYRVNFNASKLSSGTYFYRLSTPHYTAMQPMQFLK